MNKKLIKKSVIIGFFYIIFSFPIIGLFAEELGENIQGREPTLGEWPFIILVEIASMPFLLVMPFLDSLSWFWKSGKDAVGLLVWLSLAFIFSVAIAYCVLLAIKTVREQEKQRA